MNRWIVLAIALLCVTQVWSGPTGNVGDDEDYHGDEGENGADDEQGDEDASRPDAPARFLTKPTSFTYKTGETAYLPCLTENTEDTNVNWLRGTDLLFLDTTKHTSDDRFELLASTNNYTLKIKNLDSNDSSADYICQILDKPAPQTLKHELYVGNEEVVITINIRPESDGHYEAREGQTVTLSCNVHNAPKPKKVLWSKSGKRLEGTENEWGSVLTLSDIKWRQAGDYQCVVETAGPTPIVKHAHIKVKHAPFIAPERDDLHHTHQHDRKDYYTGEGANTNISCIVHSHPPLRHLSWVKLDGKEKKEVYIDGIHMKKHNLTGHVHVLEIKGVTKNDIGDYKCIGRNDMGEGEGPVIGLKDTPGRPTVVTGEMQDTTLVHHWKVFSYKNITGIELKYRKKGESEWILNDRAKITGVVGKEHTIVTYIPSVEPGYSYEYMLRVRSDAAQGSNQFLNWGPESTLKTFDAQAEKIEAESSVKGAGIRSELSMMTLMLIFAPLMYTTYL